MADMKRIVIAAPHSGSGKTTLTIGIMAALKRRGLVVAPFKVGPDFIDPGYHRLATGATSTNLDGWMCGPDFVRETFAFHTIGADVAVIEGVMGLFDGIDGVSDAGSTAEIAKLLQAPAILVVDARSQARSAAALVHGFASFDPSLKIAGVIFNNVGSANHEALLRESMAANLSGIEVIGCMPRDKSLAIPSRHLGLLTAEDNPLSEDFLGHLVEQVEEHLELERILALESSSLRDAAPYRKQTGPQCPLPSKGKMMGWPGNPDEEVASISAAAPLSNGSAAGEGIDGVGRGPAGVGAQNAVLHIAVARDAAFCFVYEDNLRLLRERGAELSFFSPLADPLLPEGISGIYLPGGYPELCAEKLSANEAMKESLRAAIEEGMPVYAECGGFIYLTRGVEIDQRLHSFAGIFPVQTQMLPRRKALGYRQITLLEESIIGRQGSIARGHEFHYSEMEEMPPTVERLYEVSRKGTVLGREGYRYRNCLASYIHLHFGSSPGIAESFVGHCRAYMTRSLT